MAITTYPDRTGANQGGSSATSAAAALASQKAAATSSLSATAAAATSGVYPNGAASNIPLGLTQASVGAITAGASGTNGTFALGFSAGTGWLVYPTGTFTVAGGLVTVVAITGPGLCISATPVVPIVSFSASTGLTGAAVALTAQLLVTAGNGYWVQSADGKQLDRYKNVAGVATNDSASVTSMLTASGSVAQKATNKLTQLWNYLTDAGIQTGVSFTNFSSTAGANANGTISGYIAVDPSTVYKFVGFRDYTNLYVGYFTAALAPINAANQITSGGSLTTPSTCAFIRLNLVYTATQVGFGDDQYKRAVVMKASDVPGYLSYQNPFPYYAAVSGETSVDGYLLDSPLTKSLVKRLGKNLFNYQKAQANIYIQSDGTLIFTSNAFAVCSPFIEVIGGAAYSISGNIAQPNGWAFYDSSYALCAGGSGVAWGFTAFGVNRVAPATAKYVRVQMTAFNAGSDLSANYRNVQIEQAAVSSTFEEYTEVSSTIGVPAASIITTPFTGKKVVFLGDSITEEALSYPAYLIAKTGAASTSVKNAVGGRTIGQFLDPQAGEVTADVTAKLTGADYIMVCGGANHRSGPYGTVTDTTQNKTGDEVQQLNYLVAQIRLTNATAPIIFVIPPTGTTDSATALAAYETAYQTLQDWCQANTYLWIPVWHDYPRSKVFPSARWYRSSVTGTATWLQGDGTHPTTHAGGGSETVANIIVDFLRVARENAVL